MPGTWLIGYSPEGVCYIANMLVRYYYQYFTLQPVLRFLSFPSCTLRGRKRGGGALRSPHTFTTSRSRSFSGNGSYCCCCTCILAVGLPRLAQKVAEIRPSYREASVPVHNSTCFPFPFSPSCPSPTRLVSSLSWLRLGLTPPVPDSWIATKNNKRGKRISHLGRVYSSTSITMLRACRTHPLSPIQYASQLGPHASCDRCWKRGSLFRHFSPPKPAPNGLTVTKCPCGTHAGSPQCLLTNTVNDSPASTILPIVPLLRGTIVNRTYGIDKNLNIPPFLLTIFGPINYGPP